MVKTASILFLSLCMALLAACASRKPAVLPMAMPDPPVEPMVWTTDSAANPYTGRHTDMLALGALLACDDSGTIWVCLPTRQGAVAEPGLLSLDARQMKNNPDMAQRTTTRTLNTIAEVADDYRFDRLAHMMRTINDGQKKTYSRLDRWHEQYIENYNINVRRTRDPLLGGYLYELGYKSDF